MVATLTLKELRPQLPKVIERIDARFDRFVITKRGRPVAVMMSVDDYESMLETLDILTDPKAMRGIQEGREDVRKGRTVSWEKLKRTVEKL